MSIDGERTREGLPIPRGPTSANVFYVVVDVGLLGVLGIVLAVPAALWCVQDQRAIPHRVWFWSGHDRRPWYWALGLGWILGGDAAVVVALVWSRRRQGRRQTSERSGMG